MKFHNTDFRKCYWGGSGGGVPEPQQRKDTQIMSAVIWYIALRLIDAILYLAKKK